MVWWLGVALAVIAALLCLPVREQPVTPAEPRPAPSSRRPPPSRLACRGRAGAGGRAWPGVLGLHHARDADPLGKPGRALRLLGASIPSARGAHAGRIAFLFRSIAAGHRRHARRRHAGADREQPAVAPFDAGAGRSAAPGAPSQRIAAHPAAVGVVGRVRQRTGLRSGRRRARLPAGQFCHAAGLDRSHSRGRGGAGAAGRQPGSAPVHGRRSADGRVGPPRAVGRGHRRISRLCPVARALPPNARRHRRRRREPGVCARAARPGGRPARHPRPTGAGGFYRHVAALSPAAHRV
ncbi:hypothetical protein G6F65_017261 [Rhizopus arrhizus]|nr:hypothetical protein G6F65_017261 [Rhizopus arrhizus]